MVIILSGCAASKVKTIGEQRVDSGDVEPDQMRPTVDTRFQELFFQAQLEKAKGNKQKAYALFEQALKIEPDNAATHYEIGRIELEDFKNPAAALEHAKFCLASDKTNPWYFKFLGNVNKELAKYDAAAKAYSEAYRLNPNDHELLSEIAEVQITAGKYREAIVTLDEMEKHTGVFYELSIQKHELYLELNDATKAGLELERLAEQNPQEPGYWGLAINFYQQRGIQDKALSAMERMVLADPDNGQVHYRLSEYYAMQKDDVRSYQELKLAFGTNDISIDQKINVLIRYYALTEMQQSYLSQAYELLALTEQMQPNEPKGLSMYGDFLFRDGKLKEALAKYKQAIAAGGSLQAIWSQVLEIELALGDIQALEEDSKRALEMFPLIPDFYYFRGLARQRLKDHTQAIEQFNLGKDLVIDNRDLQARFYASLGESYHYTVQYERSDEAFNEALRLDPSNVFTLNNYAYYLALRNVRLDAAAEMARRANELSPSVSSFQDTYAYVLFRLANYSEALVWIEKAIAHGENSPELFEHYGDILYKSGRADEALVQWKRAEELPGYGPKLKQKIATKQYVE